MNNPIRHHYVPQCYLRKFSKDKININYFDKGLNALKTEKIEEFCQENNLYYLAQNKDHYLIETKFFSYDVEVKLGDLLNFFESITSKFNKIEFNKDRRLKLSYQIVLQYMRTPKFRNNKSSNELNAYLTQIKYLFEKCYEIELEEITFTYEGAEFHKNILLDKNYINDIALEISNCEWELLTINSEEFYTSDNPVAIIERQDMPIVYCDAIKYFNDIYLPLNPQLLLHITSTVCNSFKSLTIREIDDIERTYINSIIKNKADKFIIYQNELK